jgi:hypothetical protein
LKLFDILTTLVAGAVVPLPLAHQLQWVRPMHAHHPVDIASALHRSRPLPASFQLRVPMRPDLGAPVLTIAALLEAEDIKSTLLAECEILAENS